MGIQGLLPLLKSTMVPTHIKDLKGCAVAVDTYSWLHKGALSCSRELCKGQPTTKHINYCMHRVNLLRHYGVKPILVFDGDFLPMKGDQEIKRARARKENFARAVEHESNGNGSAAYECYQKAVDISPAVAYELIQVLKKENVYYVVAPYEADAQMTFLALSKQVDAIITEDSDLIAFGCPRIIYKMDKFGQGVEFRYSKLQQNRDLNLAGFDKQMLLEMCILSGCDYLPSLPGMGLKKAHALIKKFKSYDKVIKHLRYSTVAVPPGYEESFKKAILTFQHQRVYDPMVEDIVHLTDLLDNAGDGYDFLGPSMPQHLAKGIAEGNIDPLSKMPFQEASGGVCSQTYQPKDFKVEGERRKLDLPAQKNLLTNYFCFASLEAKRGFRAPRSTTKDSNETKKTCLEEHNAMESPACRTNISPESLLDFSYLGSASTQEDNVESSNETTLITSDSPKHSKNETQPQTSPKIHLHDKIDHMGDKRYPQDPLLHQSNQSIHKHCVTLRKEAQGKGYITTRTKDNKVIIRSSYFQHKSREENHEFQTESSLGSVDITTDDCENVDSETKISSYSRGGGDGTKNRKTVSRSSYFSHKPVDKNYKGATDENIVKPGNLTASTHENTLSSSTYRDSSFKSSAMKRTAAQLDDDEATENVNYKCLRTSPLQDTSGIISTSEEDTAMGMKAEEGKFGCNISHLENYSNAAEKSMEKFISVISSFRCPKSGSRPSGLRAPLKDVQNIPTRATRSNAVPDISEFAYVPTNRKAHSAHRRGTLKKAI